MGIDNLKFRLYLLYKGAHTNLNYASTPGRGTTVDLTLPDKTDYLFAGDLEDEYRPYDSTPCLCAVFRLKLNSKRAAHLAMQPAFHVDFCALRQNRASPHFV